MSVTVPVSAGGRDVPSEDGQGIRSKAQGRWRRSWGHGNGWTAPQLLSLFSLLLLLMGPSRASIKNGEGSDLVMGARL